MSAAMMFLLLAAALQDMPAKDDAFFFTDATGSIYSMRERDLHNTGTNNPQVWVKGWHKNDRTRSERTSMTLVRIDCVEGKITTLAIVHYDAKGGSLYSWQKPSYQGVDHYIVPDTLGDAIARRACPATQDGKNP
jgi:hypothetical protein